MEGNEAQGLLRSLRGHLLDVAYPAHVVLVIDNARFERGPFLRLYRVMARDEGHRNPRIKVVDLEVVHRMSLVVLLAGRLAHAWVAREEHAGPRPVSAGQERTLAAGHVAVAVELPRVLTEVPDV